MTGDRGDDDKEDDRHALLANEKQYKGPISRLKSQTAREGTTAAKSKPD